MYRPSMFDELRPEVLHPLIDTHSLGLPPAARPRHRRPT
jgi:hypothetical protein